MMKEAIFWAGDGELIWVARPAAEAGSPYDRVDFFGFCMPGVSWNHSVSSVKRVAHG
jgi:hypothetical protein